MNWREEVAGLLNKQIRLEMYASYVYLSMIEFFDRHDVAHPHVSEFFDLGAKRKKLYSEKLIEYQNKMGGQMEFFDVNAPQEYSKDSFKIVEALKCAIVTEEASHNQLLTMHKKASRFPAFQSFLEDFEHQNVDCLDQLKSLLTSIERCGRTGLGAFLFDKLLVA